MKKKYVILLSIAIFVTGVILAISETKANIEKNLKQLTSMTITEVDLSKLKDGVYKGNYKVFPVAAEVDVTIENCKIARIDLIKHQNGQGTPAEVLPGRVVEAQKLNVDIISGATYSSKVILKAIENALSSTNK